MFNKPDLDDQLLEIFILIEDNTMPSTTTAISKYRTLHQSKTGEKLSLANANIEMRKSYDAWLTKDYKMSK